MEFLWKRTMENKRKKILHRVIKQKKSHEVFHIKQKSCSIYTIISIQYMLYICCNIKEEHKKKFVLKRRINKKSTPIKRKQKNVCGVFGKKFTPPPIHLPSYHRLEVFCSVANDLICCIKPRARQRYCTEQGRWIELVLLLFKTDFKVFS